MMRVLPSILVGLLLLSRPVPSQQADASLDGHAFHRETTDRWLHGSQRPEFTRWREPDIRHWLYIDSVRAGPAPGDRALRISLFWPDREMRADLVHDSAGRIRHIEATYPVPAPSIEDQYPAVRARMLRGSRLDSGGFGGFGLPAFVAAELIPSFDPERLEPGAEWADTLRIEGEHEGFRRSLRGIRRNRIERDTVVGGRRQWIVRDSATIRYEERWTEHDRTLDTAVSVIRGGDGVLLGSHLYDPELRLFRIRADSMQVTGEAILQYPDGREFRTPARYERLASWRLHDAEETAALREEQLAELTSRRGGMLRLPGDELQRRLREGEESPRDSLILEWHRSRDAEERARLLAMIGWAGRQDPELAERLRELALEAGDSMFVISASRRSPSPERPLERRDLDLLLPFLRDPGVSLGFGLGRDTFYEIIRDALLRDPPAIASHSIDWPCTPEACRLLADQYEAPGDQRLRDLALITRFVMEPARWADEIARRAERGSALVQPAAQLLAGVGATWPAALQAPLPPPGADWRAWLAWMAASNPEFPPPPAGFQVNPLRFEQSHFNAIRFFEARTDRAVVDEIRRRYAAAGPEEDSARAVFGAILLGMGDRWTNPDELAATLRTGSDVERTLALRELTRIFTSLQPADPEVAAELVDRLLSVTIEGADPWPELRPAEDPRRRALRQVATDGLPVYVLSDSIPAALRDRWRDRATLISAAEWEARSDRLPAILFRVAGPVRAGPFVRLRIAYESRLERREDETPAGYAGGFMIVLMEGPDGWVQVHGLLWVT